MPNIRIDQLEAEIAPVVAREALAAAAIEDIRGAVTKSVQNILAEDRDVKEQLRKQLAKREVQEERLIELAATGSLPMGKIRVRIEKTALQRAAIEERLGFTTERLKQSADGALAYLGLLSDPGMLYERGSNATRRDLLTAFFTGLVVYVTEEGVSIQSERNEANSRVREIQGQIETTRAGENASNNKAPHASAGSLSSPQPELSSFGRGLSKYHVAGVPGLEPRTTEPESAVLPITPYPKGETGVSHRGSSLPERGPERQNGGPARASGRVVSLGGRRACGGGAASPPCRAAPSTRTAAGTPCGR